ARAALEAMEREPLTGRLRDDLLPILQRVGGVRLGDSLYPHADQIVALFREALLSDEAVKAAGRIIGNLQTDNYPEPDATARYINDRRKTARAAITAALDVAAKGGE